MPTYRDIFYKKYGLDKSQSYGLDEISNITDIDEDILQEVYNRGIGAWKGNISSVRLKKDFSKNPSTKKYPRSARLSKEQWASARVYSFIVKGKTWHTADADLAKLIE